MTTWRLGFLAYSCFSIQISPKAFYEHFIRSDYTTYGIWWTDKMIYISNDELNGIACVDVLE
jgi:hypothetical protein